MEEPVIGPPLYRLNIRPMVLRLMLRRHGWVTPHGSCRQDRRTAAAGQALRGTRRLEALGWEAADQLSVIPGRLGLHQEFGALLARQLLEGDASFG